MDARQVAADRFAQRVRRAQRGSGGRAAGSGGNTAEPGADAAAFVAFSKLSDEMDELFVGADRWVCLRVQCRCRVGGDLAVLRLPTLRQTALASCTRLACLPTCSPSAASSGPCSLPSQRYPARPPPIHQPTVRCCNCAQMRRHMTSCALCRRSACCLSCWSCCGPRCPLPLTT